MTDRITLYSMPSSGNSYKLRLMLALLGRPYTHVALEDGTPELDRAKAQGLLPQGKLPALHLDDGTVLVESNAILWFLAQGSDWIPADPLDQARVLAWMFFEQNRHEPVIAGRASLRCYENRRAQATPERMAELLESGHALLAILDQGLAGRDWLVGHAPSLADIALYAYTHSAGSRGGFDMARFPNIAAWCVRMAALPGHIELDHIP
ncbi:glutathione S-transferase [Brevirhabdus pacifica]|uniref:Glutathione S-transferase n=1 Tax=Brevirhabdus pacifica TaxID=1267768 RepID=A0A1U7DJD2_9RHOB|nr:glutathione S-transferase family protein [Brevirhabdus pacifica]APX90081.1 glutathione S-transferase [Brevirhabdus pacifica]OWU75329.1 glutathione S-transferase [Loktanella sp. 22II-4b]PJJ82666.1 glutathione S-transferase [Brevirhabdus pacifica]